VLVGTGVLVIGGLVIALAYLDENREGTLNRTFTPFQQFPSGQLPDDTAYRQCLERVALANFAVQSSYEQRLKQWEILPAQVRPLLKPRKPDIKDPSRECDHFRRR